MRETLLLIRPKQWAKNVFVLLPMFFGRQLTDPATLQSSLLVFAAFSFIASSVYCINDLIDVEADRQHPVKCKRPIASGAVSRKQGWLLTVVMALLSAATVLTLSSHIWQVLAVLAGYYLLNIAYCTRLKNYAIIDVCVIAFGFVLRILAGGVATGISVSRWLVLMTFLLTLFLSLAKRRDDVLRMNATGKAPRKNTIRYNLTFINQAITITASVTTVCYIMYCVSPEVVAAFGTPNLYLTTIFVIIGLLRYIQLAVVDEQSGDPTKIVWKDRFTQLVILAWLSSFLFLIYLS
ncbi:MAG: decaprenyl-phosphate phosphoribosyltransferase [Prevotella sp.]|nr:decaprenyl-phosphate phosphoribosyltransferase [Prevotella sp.]MDY5656487.1 decaprenyl-phosphate phosphoribosyltransferase [Prevotella sp.]